MANNNPIPMKIVLFSWVSFFAVSAAIQIGINYGDKGDNLPSPDAVPTILQQHNIQRVRIFNPNLSFLRAINNSLIEVVLGTLNEDVLTLASDASYATSWINTNIIPFTNVNFKYISIGNEIMFPGNYANSLVAAIQNLDAALKAANRPIPVTTAIDMHPIAVSYPPSVGRFTDDSAPIFRSLASFLNTNGYPLLVNAYPYFAYLGSGGVSLDYVLFNTTDVVVQDGEYGYKNILYAMVDAIYAALEKLDAPDVRIVVAETGWPWSGNDVATIDYASMYNNNLISQLTSTTGTPRRPSVELETYIFSLFNEDLKPEGTERSWGILTHDGDEMYHVNFP
ncbi:hypothetical protein C5167_010713 [Papaver somniferum]|uniref:Glucan endo-1,3-beta-D-glucosidase n=1 Tax=Papaver somniferum TaxID=3469 RepID=A0A4Y7K3U8_PAPSO|nr:putative glucan endo-1,3-beta-glucosidase GVI [Papaver somniferum]RZC67020.1 hypothetical protein C5167_010713 [Papaver somniferum]